jgi:nitronate monooxygenase
MTSLRELLDIELPIIQAPMAGVQGSALTVAISGAGALGSLPGAMLGAEALRTELIAIRARTDKPYNVNFFCHTTPDPDADRETRWRATLAPYFEEFGVDLADIPGGPGRLPFSHETADVLEEFRPPVVSFHFGLPSEDLMQRIRGWGAKVLSTATTVDEARWLEAHGADAIIAQGTEAGGHRGHFLSSDLNAQMGTMALVPQVVQAVNVPVIAAGGIADAQGIAAVLALGASGAQLGTTFLLCPEATTSAVHRAALRSDAARITAITNVFTGRPARSIVNRMVRELGPISDVAPVFPLASLAVTALRAKAERAGTGECSPLWAGQNVTGCRELPAAFVLMELSTGLLYA